MKELFPLVIGNEGTKNRIGNAILGARVPHAFLIDGPRGSGKRTLATNIAAALNCERTRDGYSPLPCGKCNSCQKIFGEGHVDVRTLRKSQDRATLGVAEIKEFREDMFLSATEAEYKVYIIDDAERMTPEAQNALLIVLEEPPKNVVIILLAAGTDSILTTIKSRTQYIATSRFTPDEIAEAITRLSPAARTLRSTDPDAFTAAVMGADGCIGRAIELTGATSAAAASAVRTRTLEFIRAAAPRVPYKTVADAIEAFPSKRAELCEQFESIFDALRDMIAAKRADDPPTLFFTSAEEAKEAARPFKLARLTAIFDIVNRAHTDCTRNANVTALLTLLAAGIHQLRI